MVAANAMPLYAGPKRTSKGGMGIFPEDVGRWAATMVAAKASDRTARIGPVLSRPALKKYGEMLRYRGQR